MLTATPSTRLCCSCSYWYGPRTASENGHIYAMEYAVGLCQLHEQMDRSIVDYCSDWTQWSIPQIVPTNQQILNCWEFHNCGFEKGGKNAELHGVCPAYPDHGHSCAYLQAAKRCLILKGAAEKKLCSAETDCVRCDFFNSGHHEKLIINPEISGSVSWHRAAMFEEYTALEEGDAALPAFDESHS